MKLRRLLLVAPLLAAGLAQAHAQQPAPQMAERARLEGEIRRGFARAIRQRVGLSEQQMRQLGPVTQRHEQQRRQLQMEERRTRMALRDAIGDSLGDSAKVGRHLQALVEIQKRRVQLLEAEQRDLAAIMTPIQRAKYMAVQEQVRRRLEQMRQRRAAGQDVGSPPLPPGRPPL